MLVCWPQVMELLVLGHAPHATSALWAYAFRPSAVRQHTAQPRFVGGLGFQACSWLKEEPCCNVEWVLHGPKLVFNDTSHFTQENQHRAEQVGWSTTSLCGVLFIPMPAASPLAQ